MRLPLRINNFSVIQKCEYKSLEWNGFDYFEFVSQSGLILEPFPVYGGKSFGVQSWLFPDPAALLWRNLKDAHPSFRSRQRCGNVLPVLRPKATHKRHLYPIL